jgi:hypothetical protein
VHLRRPPGASLADAIHELDRVSLTHIARLAPQTARRLGLHARRSPRRRGSPDRCRRRCRAAARDRAAGCGDRPCGDVDSHARQAEDGAASFAYLGVRRRGGGEIRYVHGCEPRSPGLRRAWARRVAARDARSEHRRVRRLSRCAWALAGCRARSTAGSRFRQTLGGAGGRRRPAGLACADRARGSCARRPRRYRSRSAAAAASPRRRPNLPEDATT